MHIATYIRAMVRPDRFKVKVWRAKVRAGWVNVRVRISV